MRPPICSLCRHLSGSDDTSASGAWVDFADFEPLPPHVIGHPRGLEWFCSAHLPAARRLAGLPSDAALDELRRTVGPGATSWTAWLDGLRAFVRRARRRGRR